MFESEFQIGNSGLDSCTSQPGDAADPPSRDTVREALHKAVEFYRTQVATQGGYHFRYAADLSYGRPEQRRKDPPKSAYSAKALSLSAWPT